MSRIQTSLLALALCCSLCPAANPNIAVMELGGNSVAADDRAGLTNRLRSELFKTGAYTVLDRSAMDEVLREQGFQQTGCVAAECAVQAGQVMGVEKMVVGSVDKVGKTYSATVHMVDVATGKIERTATADCNNCIIDNVLLTTMRDAARVLTGLEKEKRASSTGLEPMDSAEEAAAWNGRWVGTMAPLSRPDKTSPMDLGFTVDKGTLTVLGHDQSGQRAGDAMSGTVSGSTVQFRFVMKILRTGVSTTDFQGTRKDGTIAGTYTSLFTHLGRSVPGEGTWTVTRKQ